MRGEARGRPALQNVQEDGAKPVAENVGLLSAGAGVADMVAWARDGNETPAEKRYNPSFSKADLFRLGYIAERSGHSTGAALDLTLVDLRRRSAAFDPDKAYGDCIAP